MAKIIFNDEEEETIPDGAPLKEFCEEAGVPFACEEGICGTCVIEIRDGGDNLSEPTQEEIDFLGDDPQDERLACQCKIKQGEVTISF